jgi:tetratricopeptide (TPR) repeat protein
VVTSPASSASSPGTSATPLLPTAPWPVRAGAVPPLADRFSPRPETAPDLAVALGRSVAVGLVPRTGPAGMPEDMLRCCGKTQLAAYFAESQWHARTIDLLMWVDASSQAAVLSGYQEVASALTGRRVPGTAAALASSLLSWLHETDRRWLLVMDDLNDAGMLTDLWPSGPSGRVIVTAPTTATLAVLPEVLTVEVGPFSRREAMSYLVGRLSSDPDQRRGAIDLIEDLGCHPLALSQATAAIGSSWMTCVDYRQLFATKSTELPSAGGWPLPPQRVTWWLSLDHADRLRPGGAVQACLALAALMDPHGFPVAVFSAPSTATYVAGPRVDASRAAEQSGSAVLALEKAGLLMVDRSADPPLIRMDYSLHNAVRNATPQEMRDQATRSAAAALMELWADSAFSSRLPVDALLCASAESLRRATGRLLWTNGCDPLLFRIGQSLDEAGLTGPAVEYWSELTATSEQLFGPGHPDSMALVERLAGAYMAADRPTEAIAWYKRIMSDWAVAFGPDHSRAIAARINLGRVLVTAGLPEDAISVLGSALADIERSFGADHPETQALRDELATAYAAAGHNDQAIRLYRRTLADRERKPGPQDPATISTRLRLADAYQADGRLKDAISQYKRVVADRERRIGADHPDSLRAKASLAAANREAGRMAVAVQLYEEVRNATVRVLGPDNIDSLNAGASLAGTYYAVGRLTDAADLYREVAERGERALQPGHPLTLAARESLASITGE